MINTKLRSNQVEIMDDFAMTGEVLTKTLDQIAMINKLLGGNSITINGLKKILYNQPKDKNYIIVDLGCGNGDMLRLVADFGRNQGYKFELIGVDANLHTISYAKELSKKYPEISYIQQDVLGEDFKGISCEIMLSTLFLHHFTDEESLKLLDKLLKKTSLGIVINDLHRHLIAYYLFKVVCLTIKNPMVKNDGLISILRGFKKEDLKKVSIKLGVKSSVRWKWAFRYQWVIQK